MYRVPGIFLSVKLVLQIHDVVMHVPDAAPISLRISLDSIGSPRKCIFLQGVDNLSRT
jgi:hypothetical protein